MKALERLESNMKTFTKDIFVPSQEFNTDSNQVEPKKIKRTFTFRELDEYDQDQQKLHFKLNAIFENAIGESDEKVGEEKRKITIDSDGVHELVIKFINTCLITVNDSGEKDDKKELDKRELLMNSKALYKLGSWLVAEKFLPFFLTFRAD